MTQGGQAINTSRLPGGSPVASPGGSPGPLANGPDRPSTSCCRPGVRSATPSSRRQGLCAGRAGARWTSWARRSVRFAACRSNSTLIPIPMGPTPMPTGPTASCAAP